MVIRVGFEPTAIRLKVECSTTELPDQGMVDRGGLEPPTYRLSSGCSNQLSYQSKTGEGAWIRTKTGGFGDRRATVTLHRRILAETVGFEPTEAEAHLGGLANRYLKPLGHISKTGGLGEFRNLDLGVKSPSLCL